MAQGTVLVFNDFKKRIGDGTHDLDNDVFKLALINSLPTISDVTPQLSSYTEVSGTNYTAGGEILTMTWVESGGNVDWTHTAGVVTWTVHASGPPDIVAGIIYNSTNPSYAVAFIDFTTDAGTTPLSLVDGNITWTPEPKIFRLS